MENGAFVSLDPIQIVHIVIHLAWLTVAQVPRRVIRVKGTTCYVGNNAAMRYDCTTMQINNSLFTPSIGLYSVFKSYDNGTMILGIFKDGRVERPSARGYSNNYY